MENKPKFWETPYGKVMSFMVHEHSGGLGLSGSYAHLMEQRFRLLGIVDEDLLKYLEGIRSGNKRMREAIDYGYEGIKKLQGYE